ncbi:MAG: RNA 2',3'-cyclic phosphodiesterase, partial [Synergistetes bacterium]|nr:RNA 2',3'-cyclic phosphodiesterase [Synergistota bacterium]
MAQREIIRSFVCIEIPVDIRNEMEGFLKELRGLDRRVKWVKGENLHLTLKFLGEEPHTKVERIRSSLQSGIPDLNLKPFSLSLRGIGAFP